MSEQTPEEMTALAAALGLGEVRSILHTATVLWKGWEMDNEAWIFELEDGSRAAVCTSHGGANQWTLEDAKESLRLAEESAASIRKAIELWPGEDGS